MQAQTRKSHGFTLMEVLIVVALIGVISLISTTLMRGALADSRAKGAVRDLADLLLLARSEAIRTGVNHLVFFEKDAQDQALVSAYGRPAAGVVVPDANGNGKIDGGESSVASVLIDDTGSLQWGAAFAGPAARKAPILAAPITRTPVSMACSSSLCPTASSPKK